MLHASVLRIASLLSILFILGGTHGWAAAAPFPMFDCIAPNVAFWTKVYTQYSTTQGIVHDSVDLNIIYEIIALKPYDTLGARKINTKRMKQANENYRRILKRLAHNPQAADAESQRVAGLFGDQRDAKLFRLAAGRVRCQIGQKDRFMTGLIRSGAYINEIRAIFQSYNLPEDLAYLPHVESSFNPNAYSKFGAAGIWQFTRSTGKRFMEVGYVLDERRDPIKASHAAAQLLRENYARLGNWPLAITAYNHGAGGMERAKRSHGEYPEIFKSYRSRIFKFASRNFYSEFLAARQIAHDYQAYFGELDLDQPVPSRTVILEGYTAFEDLCEHMQIAPDILKGMNLALRAPVFNGQKHIPKGYALRLPMGSAESDPFLLAGLPTSLYKETQKPSRFYTVRPGDTASKIARLHKVKVNDLILANNLNHRAVIYPSQTLRIPLPGEPIRQVPQPSVPAHSPTLVAVAELSKENASTTTVEVEAKPVSYPRPILASIIPIPQPVAPPEIETALTEQPSQETSNLEIVAADVHIEKVIKFHGRPVGIIQVEVEETLGHYADWAGVRTQQIRSLNALRYGSVLHLHQKVKIPLHKTPAPVFEENRYEYHKRLQEDFFAVYQIGEMQPYRVQRSDNYWSLCREKFDMPLWLLKHSNPDVDLADLRLHQKLMIPTIEKVTADEPTIASTDDTDEVDPTQPEEEVALKKVNSH